MKWKQIQRVCIVGCLAMMSMYAVDAASLDGIRAVNETGHTRVVLDMSGMPSNWSTAYDKDTHTIAIRMDTMENALKRGVVYSDVGPGVLKGVSLVTGPQSLILKVKATQAIKYNMFSLKSPDRLVLDMYSDYSQKTTRNIDHGIAYTHWTMSQKKGHVEAYVLTVNAKEPMGIGFAGTAGKTLPQVIQPATATVGVQRVGTPGPANQKTDIGPYEQLEGTAQLRYTPANGYTIKSAEPFLDVVYKNNRWAVTDINRPRMTNALVIYTPAYGKSTRTNQYGYEVVVAGQKVIAVGKNNSPLRPGDIVISGHGTQVPRLKQLTVGSTVHLEKRMPVAKLQLSDAVVYNGGQSILEKGYYTGYGKDDPLAPRSFLGVSKTGDLYVLTVPQQPNVSVGITTEGGAQLLQELGAYDGVELTHQGQIPFYFPGQKGLGDKEALKKPYEYILVFP